MAPLFTGSASAVGGCSRGVDRRRTRLAPMSAGEKPRVAVVFGGRSSEHAVSCATAASVLAAIDRDAYDVVPIGITKDGRWVLESGDPERLALTAGHEPEVDASA